ncbi:hypothetical protein CMI46_02580 [Candidatus Pacearchaeota archaeon]|nr:hypothetical protein [Candidatus Pacearchaeota archaeon]|tara:strand:- start:8087 stop:8386 length:300 start_codon:yes stop_codon:yes gene_type:complete
MKNNETIRDLALTTHDETLIDESLKTSWGRHNGVKIISSPKSYKIRVGSTDIHYLKKSSENGQEQYVAVGTEEQLETARKKLISVLKETEQYKSREGTA